MSRLREEQSILMMESYLGYHLGEQFHQRIDMNILSALDEAKKLSFLPHVLGLMPVGAVRTERRGAPIKPIIVEHLRGLGVDIRPLLVDVIKDICDNFARTGFSNLEPRLRLRKASIGDLRQRRDLYSRIRTRQGGRCACCGTLFGEGPREETLDHIIPWRLGGDPPGGWNWQLLCRGCNGVKDTIMAAYSMPERHNWIYPDLVSRRDPLVDTIGQKTRYLTLIHYGKCQYPGCNATPKSSELHVSKQVASGFAVFDHLTVYCDAHLKVNQ